MPVRLGDLVQPVDPVPHDSDLKVAVQRIRNTPDLRILPVCRHGAPAGLLIRDEVLGIALEAGQFLGERRVPLSSLLKAEPFQADVSEPAAYVAKQIADAGGFDFDRGVIATEQGRYVGWVPGRALLTSVAQENARRAAVMHRQREQLQDAHAARAQAVEDQARFLAFVSHEIRTPLTGVLGLADLLCDARLDAPMRDYALTIASSGRLLERLLQDLLDLSRLKAGKMPIVPTPFKLADFGQETKALWSTQTDKKDVSLSVVCDDRLSDRIEADAMRLRQILFNLVANAVKYTDTGKIDVSLKLVEQAGTGLALTMSVADTGKGISDEDKTRLFDLFEQAHPDTAHRFGGAGVGLTVARSLADRMGGSIAVSDTDRGGAMFTVNVPVRRAGPRLAVENERPKSARLELGRILVADDDEVSRLVLVQALTAAGWTVDQVSNAADVLSRTAGQAYQAILLDVHLEGTTGLTLGQRIRKGEGPCQQAALIAVTADVRDQVRAASERAGFDAFLAKPVRTRELVATLVDAIMARQESGSDTVLMRRAARLG